MYRHIIRLIKTIAGVILIAIGIISGFIPIIQGWIFIVAGLLLLGVKEETMKGWLRNIKSWFKKSK